MYLAKAGGGTIANAGELHLLAPGAVALLTENDTIIASTAVAADINHIKQFYIAVGEADATLGARRSVLIDRDAFVLTQVDYNAPAKQVTQVGLSNAVGSMNFPASYENGTFATIVITDTTPGRFEAKQVRRYTVPVNSGSTDASVIAALIAAFAADEDSIVVGAALGAGSDEGITITAKDFGTTFTVGVYDIIQYATVHPAPDNNSVAMFLGSGTADQVRELLYDGNIQLGDSLRGSGYRLPNGTGGFYTRADQTVSGTCTIYSLEWQQENRNSAQMNRGQKMQANIAVLTSATTVLGVIDTLLNLLHTSPTTGSGSAPLGFAAAVDDAITAGGHA